MMQDSSNRVHTRRESTLAGRWLTAVCVALLLAACGQSVQPPPLDVSHRDSLLGAGRILQITNTGNEALSCPEVRIETPSGDVKNHNLGTLASGELVELGWKKLGGFEIVSGADVTFECEGYLRPLAVTLGTAANE